MLKKKHKKTYWQEARQYISIKNQNVDTTEVKYILKIDDRGFPGGSVVKNPPANAGDTGLIPDLGRRHMPQATKPMCHNY